MSLLFLQVPWLDGNCHTGLRAIPSQAAIIRTCGLRAFVCQLRDLYIHVSHGSHGFQHILDRCRDVSSAIAPHIFFDRRVLNAPCVTSSSFCAQEISLLLRQ